MNIRFAYVIVLCVWIGQGFAQTTSKSDTPEKKEEQASQPRASGPHDTVTVTATRNPTPLPQIGQAITVITAEEIEAQGARDVLQILETVPGFSVARTGSFGGNTSVFVRGGESDFNLVLIDGVQVNQPGGAFDFADLTTTNIEQIEVVRGPASVLYGADAVTSVINIITRKGQGGPSGRLQVEGGSFDSYLFQGNLQGALKQLHYSFGAHYSKSDGFFDLNNQYDKVELSGNTIFDLTSTSFLKGNFRFSDSDSHFPTSGTGAVVDPNDFRKTDERLYSLSYQNQVNRTYSTNVQYGYYARDFRSFSLEDGIVDFFDSDFTTRENRHYMDWQNNLQLGHRSLLTAGVSFEREELEQTDESRHSVGVYLQNQWSWADRVFLTGGLRFDQNSRFRSFTSGSASLAYLLNRDWKVRTSIGNGFRAPNFIEIVGLPDFGILGSTELNPEKNIAADFGIDYLPTTHGFGLSATAFFNRFSDLIEFSFAVPTGTSNYLNIERAKSEGLELSGFASPADRLRLGGQYTLTTTEVTDSGTVPGGSFVEGERLLRRPRHLAGLFAQFTQTRTKFRVDLHFKGSRDDVQFFPDFSSARVILPSYWKLNVSVTIPVLKYSDTGDGVAVIFRGENILNKQYEEVAGFESPGRSLFAGLQMTF
jgi:vitamin B12 transporter